MTHYAAMAARFLCFYVMAALTSAAISIVVAYILRVNSHVPPENSPDITAIAFTVLKKAIYGAPLSLIVSAWGWNSAKAVLAPTDIRPAFRAALQGGISWSIGYIVIGIWMMSLLVIVTMTLLSAPVGAFWGWLIYYKIWPESPPDTERPAAS